MSTSDGDDAFALNIDGGRGITIDDIEKQKLHCAYEDL